MGLAVVNNYWVNRHVLRWVCPCKTFLAITYHCANLVVVICYPNQIINRIQSTRKLITFSAKWCWAACHSITSIHLELLFVLCSDKHINRTDWINKLFWTIVDECCFILSGFITSHVLHFVFFIYFSLVLYTVSQIKRGHFSFRHNFYNC